MKNENKNLIMAIMRSTSAGLAIGVFILSMMGTILELDAIKLLSLSVVLFVLTTLEEKLTLEEELIKASNSIENNTEN